MYTGNEKSLHQQFWALDSVVGPPKLALTKWAPNGHSYTR